MKKSVLAILLLCFLALNYSCVRRYGCTDSNAENFDLKADLPDGSCYYTCYIGLYWDGPSAAFWNGNSVTELNFYYNNVLVGKQAIESGVGDTVQYSTFLYDDNARVFIAAVDQTGDTVVQTTQQFNYLSYDFVYIGM